MADKTEKVNTPTEETTLPAGGTPTIESMTAELAKVQAALHKVNSESAGRRKRLEELEAAETTRKAAALTAEQKLATAEQAKLDLEAQLQVAQLKALVLTCASKLNFASPEDAFALLDLEGVDVENVKAIEKALETLAKSNRLPLKGALPKGAPVLPGLQSQSQTNTQRVVPSPGRRL